MKKLFAVLLILFVSSCATAPKVAPLPAIYLSAEGASSMKGTHSYWLELQIPQRKLILANSDHIIKVYDVAVGMPSYPTPTGWRSLNRVIWNPWWIPPPKSDWVKDATPVPPRSPDNPLGEIKMPLGTDGYLMHGTKAVYSIGTWASHGCIRMLFEDIFGVVELLMTEYAKESAVTAMEKANRDPNTEFTIPFKKEIPIHLTYEPVKISSGYVTISPDLYSRYPSMVEMVASTIEPYLPKNKTANTKKIRTLLKTFKDQTIHISIAELAM